MSFIVKGAEPPKTCLDCPLADVEQGWCDSDMVTIIDFNERPVECPLVALPDKHGRLVDADAFKADYGMKDDCADCEKEMRGKVKACEYDRIYSKMDFCSWIDVADTIVEAEDNE